MDKRNILFVVSGDNKWIGGLYYIKNILYSYTSNEKAMKNSNVYILVKRGNEELFNYFSLFSNISIIYYEDTILNKIAKKVSGKITKSIIDINIIKVCQKYSIDYIYPCINYPYMGVSKKCVYWIPDFQHIHIPELFSEKELNYRNKKFSYFANSNNKIVLSSRDACNDFQTLYPNSKSKVFVVPFVSYIEEEKAFVNENVIDSVSSKYKLPEKYIYIPNQFWMHKNHIVAFKAMNLIVNKYKRDITLICTGNTSDYRNKNYFNKLIKYIQDEKLENNIKILGFISRIEQLSIMKKAILIIQPSLFEGWGTVVEDAKALDKRIILSDISIHVEQANDKCILFSRNDENELANKIMDNIDINLDYSKENTNNVKERAMLYSKELENVFEIND